MKSKEAIDTLCIKIRQLTGSPFGSLQILSDEYTSKFPKDTVVNNILRNCVRKLELGIDVTDEVKFLNERF